MELQNYIQNKDYFQEFKNLKLNVRKYSKMGLMMLRLIKIIIMTMKNILG